MYGPIPIIDKNISVGAETEATYIKRESIDSVVNY